MNKIIDTKKCPLCGKENNCMNIKCNNDAANNCWCNDPNIQFSADLTAQVPEICRNQTCICAACVRAYHAKKL